MFITNTAIHKARVLTVIPHSAVSAPILEAKDDGNKSRPLSVRTGNIVINPPKPK